ncbi:cupin domain-containing protein [Rhizobiales bacterium TNE-4]|nr:cupin domain-containing protein [Rhizobiales bacterium TNE-4]MBV1828898.1 cupin domain-containing protein [Rhizobiales bacterium TNE-4]
MNIFEGLLPRALDEQIDLLAASAGVRIERIVSRGHISPPAFWYDQADDEWVLVVQGSSTIAFEDGETITLRAGDHCFIPSHRRHRVEETADPTIWIAIFIAKEQV